MLAQRTSVFGSAFRPGLTLQQLYRSPHIRTYSTQPTQDASSITQSSSTASSSSSSSSSTASSSPSQAPPSLPPSDLQKRVLHIRRVARTTSGGKIRTVSAIVVVGDGNGAGGYGIGRAEDVSGAISKATRLATKNMIPIQRFEHRTIFGDIDFKFHCVNLSLRAAPPGYGIVANNHIHEICRCIGISDISAKVRGSLNPLNIIQATFLALQKQKNPVEISRARGRKLVDISSAYFGVGGDRVRKAMK